MNTQNMGRVGDLLVQFGDRLPLSGRWGRLNGTIVAQDSEWRLVSEPPRLGWSGFPCRKFVFGSWLVWVVGELYGGSDRTVSDEQFIEDLVLGKTSWRQLNGHLAILAWDASRREWHVWTDRFGTVHVFHCPSANNRLLGTSFHAVSCNESLSTLDWDGLAGYFGCGFFPDDRTYFNGVRILKPATETVFDECGRKLTSKRYWEWSHQPDPSKTSIEWSDEFGHLFLRVMGELTKTGRLSVPISGGLDSRSTLAGLGAIGGGTSPTGNIWSYSYGYTDDSIETRISAELAASRGLPFERFTIRPYFRKRLGNVIGCIEGFQDFLQSRQAFVVDELAAHSEFVVAAHWGDVWHDDMGFHKTASSPNQVMENPVVEHTFGKMAKRGRQWLWDKVCRSGSRDLNPEKAARGFVQDGIERIRGIEDPDFRIKVFKTENWSFRWTLASIRMYQAAAFPRLPFYDTRIADFFLEVPTSQVAGRAMQLEYLRRFAPDLARVRWQETGRDLFHQGSGGAVGLAKRVASRLRRTLLNKPVIERNWEVQFSGPDGDKLLREALLGDRLQLHEIVDQRSIESLLNDFHNSPLVNGRGYSVSMLFSFATWLESRSRMRSEASLIPVP